MPKYDPKSTPTKLKGGAVLSGRYDLCVESVEECWSNTIPTKLGYRVIVIVQRPVEFVDRTIKLYFNVGSEKDPGCEDPMSHQKGNFVVLNAIIERTKARRTTDFYTDLKATCGKIFQSKIKRNLRAGTTDEYNNDIDGRSIAPAGTLDCELFEEMPKDMQPEPSRVPAATKPVDDDDPEPTERPDLPPPGSVASGVKGRVKKGDIKTCPKCDGEFPKSEILGHLSECKVVGDDDDDDVPF